MPDVTDTLTVPVTADTPPVLSRYALLREAGRGGMSVVYEARDRHTGETVAVKVLTPPPSLTPGQAEGMLSRFLREARAVAGVSHPNIIAIHETGAEAGRHFLVMEFLHGETLRERLLRGPMTPDQAEPVLRQIADALDAVHARGVVHQDIKPSNVMLMLDGTAKLLDFGVARRSDDTAVMGMDTLIGSPAYMSPEQVRGDEGTPASDIWALGALLYEMLAGRPPFAGRSIPAVLYQVTHEPPAPIPEVSAPIQRVLGRALEKHPPRRYPSARALADALRAALPASAELTPKRGLLLWPWAVAFVPVLLGVALVTLSRYQTIGSLRPLMLMPAPAVHHPTPPLPSLTLSPPLALSHPFERRHIAGTGRAAVWPGTAPARYRVVRQPPPARRSVTPAKAVTRTARRAWGRRHSLRRAGGHRDWWVNTLSAHPALAHHGRLPRTRWDDWGPMRLVARRLPPRQAPFPAQGHPGEANDHGDDSDDPTAADRLNRFIYSPEGTGM